MAKFAGRSALAPIDLAVDNEARTDSLGDKDNNEIPRSLYFIRTKPKFSQSNGVGIVFDHYIQTRRLIYPMSEIPV